jgi:hydrogenase nickel incorporation protein HypA/HybF
MLPEIAYNSNREMHELSITESILSIVLEKANEAHASKVSKINLVIGELSGVVDECVQFYFDFLSKDTIAAEATLSFLRSPTQLRCRNCATVFAPQNGNWACPNCQEQSIEIISGRQLYVESIEVE